MTREYKTRHFQVKAVNDETGEIEAYGSVFNIVDEGDGHGRKDRVKPGAFKRTIKNSKQRVQDGKANYLATILWQHNSDQPIGGWSDLTEDSHGLLAKGRLVLSIQQGKECYELIKAGVIDQFSIGYDIMPGGYEWTEDGVRDLKELRLWEISPVTFAMNPEALLVSVKAKKSMPEKKDFNSHYSDSLASDVLEDLWDVYYALGQAFRDAFSIGDTPMDDMKASMEQFNEAMLAMTQRGIDTNLKQYLADQQSSGPNYLGLMSADDNRERKAGGMSQSKKDTIQSHIDSLHSMADEHKSAANKHTKAMHSAADDLATVLQGSEPAYTSDHGTPEKATSPQARSHKEQHSSSDDTAELNDAMATLAKLRNSLKS